MSEAVPAAASAVVARRTRPASVVLARREMSAAGVTNLDVEVPAATSALEAVFPVRTEVTFAGVIARSEAVPVVASVVSASSTSPATVELAVGTVPSTAPASIVPPSFLERIRCPEPLMTPLTIEAASMAAIRAAVKTVIFAMTLPSEGLNLVGDGVDLSHAGRINRPGGRVELIEDSSRPFDVSSTVVVVRDD